VITRLIKPTDLTANAVSKNSIELNWKDNTVEENGYIIEQMVEGTNNWLKVDTVGLNEVKAITSNLEAATVYSFRLYAYSDREAISDYSNTATDTTERDANKPYGKVLAVTGLEGVKSDTVSIEYELILKTGKNCQTVNWSYSLNGTDWAALDSSDILNNTMRLPGQHQIEWLTLTKLDSIDDESVWFRMQFVTDDTLHYSSWINSPPIHIDNNLPPSALLLTVIGEQTGDVTIQYTTEDTEGDNVSLKAEFSTNGITNWSVGTIENTGATATATITFNDAVNNDETITIISTDGTSITYTSKPIATAGDSDLYFSSDGDPATVAEALKVAIESSGGHAGKITVSRSGPVLTLTQAAPGSDGNTVITKNLTNVTKTNFTGGGVINTTSEIII
jgi:hypothetical protein